MNIFREGMTNARLDELLARFARLRIAVLGDFFLDKYLDLDPRLTEVSIETGKVAHQVVATRHAPGAAGTVVCNLASLGVGTIYAIGLTGDDGEGYELRRDLLALGCDLQHLHCDPERVTPTYLKPRDATDPTLAGEHSRYDTKHRKPTSPEAQEKVITSLEELVPKLDAVAILDQVEEDDCGVVTGGLVARLAGRAPRYPSVTFWADSRRRIGRFRNVIIKPNQFEALGIENPRPGTTVDEVALLAAAESLRAQTAAPLFITRGESGILVSDPVLTAVPAVRVKGSIDTTGAGDSTTAGCLAALAAGATLPEAALLGNLVASITVQQLATTGTAKPDQLSARLELWREQNR